MAVDVSVVRSPGHSSVAHLTQSEIREGLEGLRRVDGEMSQLPLNGRIWTKELRRLEHWASLSDEERVQVWWDEDDHEVSSPQRVEIKRRNDRILDFPAHGAGPTDEMEARRDLSRLGVVMAMTVAGNNPVVVHCDPALVEVIGEGTDRLTGRHAMELLPVLTQRFGELNDYQETSRTDDRADVVITFPQVEVHCTMVPLRADSGRAEEVRMLIAIVER